MLSFSYWVTFSAADLVVCKSGTLQKFGTWCPASKLRFNPAGSSLKKDLFYGLHSSRNVQPVQSLKQKGASSKIPQQKARSSVLVNINTKKAMHPEEVQISRPLAGLMEVKNLKPQEGLEDDIDVEEVELSTENGNNEELNGNGFHHKENGHSVHPQAEKNEVPLEEKLQAEPFNGADVKSVLRLKSSRRNSTSSRSSSVSSARSLKQQLPTALQMEVSMDYDEREHMEPLIIEGTAEDLEVSMSVSHDDADDGVTTDSEAPVEVPVDNDEYEDESVGSEQASEAEVPKKVKSPKPPKAAKIGKSPKTKAELKVSHEKVKTPRARKGSKTAPKIFDEVDDYSDTNSVSKDDTESEDLNMKYQKSPSKRSKLTPPKLAPVDELEPEDKEEVEPAPRRSSRTRQTPQKYNSAQYVESYWDEDRLNNSDAPFSTAIRSVKGRRSLRKSRNISALNSSLHNESSPWDNEFKVLTPCGGGVSVHNVSVSDNVDISTPVKRKAEDENEEENDRGQKKMCVESTDLDNSSASQTSSFFSVITSPIMLLKNKLRGSYVSSSTPVKEQLADPQMDVTEPLDADNKDVEVAADAEKKDADVPEEASASPTSTVDAPEVQVNRNWCSIM
ncbi:uncharacterized protein LOC117639438 isoform X2 [Thrips palmi]|uniref:Uncharacterized protein LOC117639438 isoform X2 n=1 Tax=Thrips palmi TaxID=161013 RepID=A0A6P8Y3S1_THRPL|nr:uncharacterized protein LOC117639438 isoform X2 [Thrips palmi]